MSKLIDFHRHLWDTDWFPPGHRMNFAVTAANRRFPPRDPLTILPRVGKDVYDPDGTAMIRDMAELGIDTSVIMILDWGIQYMQNGGADSPTPIADINRHILGLCEKYGDKVYGFMGVDPRRKGAVQLLETAVKEWGARGYKPYTPGGYYADDLSLMPMYAKCVELNVPVLVHCGGRGWAIPGPLERVAKIFPICRSSWATPICSCASSPAPTGRRSPLPAAARTCTSTSATGRCSAPLRITTSPSSGMCSASCATASAPIASSGARTCRWPERALRPPEPGAG